MKGRRKTLCLFLSVLFLFVSCREDRPNSVKTEFFSMDTVMTVTVFDGTEEEAEKLKRQILDFEQRFSLSVADSELSRFNAEGKTDTPSPEFAEMLCLSLLLYERTGGMYDVSVLPLLELWGFAGEGEFHVPTDEERQLALEAVGADRITVGSAGNVNANGVKITFGSLAKGYVAQKTAERMKADGFSGILSLGGNVQTVGQRPDGSLFRVGIADPEKPNEIVGILEVGECAVVTSGDYQRYFTENGKKYHHLLNAKTGEPSESDLLSVTVVCPDGLTADGLSSALFLLGREGAMAYYEKYGGFEAVLIDKDHGITVTRGLIDKYCHQNGDDWTVYK